MKVRKIIASFLILISLAGFSTFNINSATAETSISIEISSSGTIEPQSTTLAGVTYNPRRMEAVTDEMLIRDFSRFKDDGIGIISLSLYWYRLEGNTQSDYNGTYSNGIPYGNLFLDHVKRFINMAEVYDIKVLVTFHTLWQNDEWCTPDYVIDNEGNNSEIAIVQNEDMKSAFLAMVNNTITYLKDEEIYGWALLNEPWGISYKESFLDLIHKGATMIREVDGRPVTVKFVSSHTWTRTDGTHGMNNHFDIMWSWDERIFNDLDFIGLNCYIQYPELYEAWFNITRENIDRIIENNKEVMITEFGYNSDDDGIQAEYYRKSLDAFNNSELSAYLAWSWNEFNLEQTQGWNLLKDKTGTPRQAYYELLDR